MVGWLPWKFFTKHLARSQGFIDPIGLYARLQNFSQPSEVGEPIELLRAGVIMHARGLVNSRAIQHNLDWVWPYWVEKQFNPHDKSFVPRAFSVTHINLTHRNWSAIGVPEHDELPIVDPRGLITPFWDGWSIDTWFLPDKGDAFLPSRSSLCRQLQHSGETDLSIQTRFNNERVMLDSFASVQKNGNDSVGLNLDISIHPKQDGWLVVSVRPYNPEGVSFIDKLSLTNDRSGWIVNGKKIIIFDRKIERHHSSNYKNGDVFIHLKDRQNDTGCDCGVGMVTAAAMFRAPAQELKSLNVSIPLDSTIDDFKSRGSPSMASNSQDFKSNDSLSHTGYNSNRVTEEDLHSQRMMPWVQALAEKTELRLPEKKWVDLYEAAVRTLVLCSPEQIYAGPFTYKRFWYRDAVYIAHGLLSAGLVSRAREVVLQMPNNQKRNGYFHSQDGEWDSNGQVLWLYRRYLETTKTTEELYPWSVVKNGADWIVKKRLRATDAKWPGLMPAGFSAEHLGPNDYYYWDDFWSVAGLEAAAWVAGRLGLDTEQVHYKQQAISFRNDIEQSLNKTAKQINQSVIPAAAGRRMDAGAIGSVVASYPLRYYRDLDQRMLATLEEILENNFVNNGFFQDMIHSGVNPYLSLHVAQSLLRAGDQRFLPIVNAVADLASPTGHWPEAVHPHTNGGCMGDGHHAWASAEWLAMMRSLFIREEDNEIVLGSGLSSKWLATGELCKFGPTPTAFGAMTVEVLKLPYEPHAVQLTWSANWHSMPPKLSIAIPGCSKVELENAEQSGTVIARMSDRIGESAETEA